MLAFRLLGIYDGLHIVPLLWSTPAGIARIGPGLIYAVITLQATRLNREKVEHNDHLLAVEEKMAEIKQTIKNQPNMDIEDPDSRSIFLFK